MAQPRRYLKLYDRDWLYDHYITKRMSDMEISKLVGCCNATVSLIRQKLEISAMRNSYKKHDTNKRFVNKENGYAFRYLPNHPSSDHKGCIREHRLVMEEFLGRPLESLELVHHINGVKDDNRIENLMLVQRGKTHAYNESEWKLFWWAKDNPAEAKELVDKLGIPCAPSETKRLDPS